MARTHEEIISFPQGGMVKSCAALLFYRSMVCFSPSCPDAFFRRLIDLSACANPADRPLSENSYLYPDAVILSETLRKNSSNV